MSVPTPLSASVSETAETSYLAEEGWLRVGEVKSTHGLRGRLNIWTADAAPDWLNTQTPLNIVPQSPVLKRLHPAGWQGTLAAAKTVSAYRARIELPGIDTPEAAAAWVKAAIYVRTETLPTASHEEDEYRTHELMGLEVYSATRTWGQVSAIVSDRAKPDGDVLLEITLAHSGKAVFIPFQACFIAGVSMAERRIEIQGLDDFLSIQDVVAEPKAPKMTPYQKRKARQAFKAQRNASATTDASVQPE
jgi:16S rRNA processing protein RimM